MLHHFGKKKLRCITWHDNINISIEHIHIVFYLDDRCCLYSFQALGRHFLRSSIITTTLITYILYQYNSLFAQILSYLPLPPWMYLLESNFIYSFSFNQYFLLNIYNIYHYLHLYLYIRMFFFLYSIYPKSTRATSLI